MLQNISATFLIPSKNLTHKLSRYTHYTPKQNSAPKHLCPHWASVAEIEENGSIVSNRKTKTRKTRFRFSLNRNGHLNKQKIRENYTQIILLKPIIKSLRTSNDRNL